jgi:hypothetical protein
MGLPTLGCKADVGEGTDGTDSAEVLCKFTVDCDGVSRQMGCKADVGEGTDGTDSAEVLCKFTVDCDGVSRQREAYVRRRGMLNANSTK